MRVVVVGAAGQLGSALLATAPVEHSVVPLTRNDLDLRSRSDISHVVRDLRPDVLINASAYTGVELAESEPESAFAINEAAVAELAAASSAIACRLIHVSTD